MSLTFCTYSTASSSCTFGHEEERRDPEGAIKSDRFLSLFAANTLIALDSSIYQRNIRMHTSPIARCVGRSNGSVRIYCKRELALECFRFLTIPVHSKRRPQVLLDASQWSSSGRAHAILAGEDEPRGPVSASAEQGLRLAQQRLLHMAQTRSCSSLDFIRAKQDFVSRKSITHP